MRGFTTPLWPVRLKPLPDELLSCWLVRIAHGHGLKVQTFCNRIFGNRHQVWNRDVDRLAPAWLVDELSLHTGVPRATAYATTLRAYEGLLYARFSSSGALPWIQTLKMYHRLRQGHGQQFCPRCLAGRPEPYFQKSWRVAFNTVCLKHHCMLHDGCPECGRAVMFHRMDMGRGSVFDADPLSACYACGFDLCRAPARPIISYDARTSEWLRSLWRSIEPVPGRQQPGLDVDTFLVMHQLMYLLMSTTPSIALREHVLDQLGVQDIEMTGGRVPFETRPLDERHHLMQIVAWLMVDLEPRLRDAWRAKAVRYNHLLKGFNDPPESYMRMAEKFSDWRRAGS
jgi:hypothetical protein